MTTAVRPGGDPAAHGAPVFPSSEAQQDPRAELRFASIVTALFAIVLSFALANHEMWRDELQAWMLARDSGSLTELYANTRYEGHPGLWFILLHAVSRLTRSTVALQVVHGLIATTTVFLIAWRAPFSRSWRAPIPFGYFFVYGYAVVSRSYALGVLLLVVWCVARTERPTAYTLQAVILALLANTSVYGAMLAAAGLASMAVPVVFRGEWRAPQVRRGMASAALLMGVGLAASAWWMVPPRQFLARMDVSDPSREDPAVVRAGLTPVRSFLPVPSIAGFPRIYHRNALLWDGGLRRRTVGAVLGAGLLLGAVFLVRRRGEAVVLFASFTAMYLFFEMRVHAGSLYHHGHLFVAFVASLWLAGALSRPERVLVGVLLVIQLLGAAPVLAADAVAPFSGARATAAYLERTGRADGVIIGAPSAPASAVSGYLDRSLVYPDRGITGTFVPWGVQSLGYTDMEGPAVDEARLLLNGEGGRPVTIILTDSLMRTHAGMSLTLLASVTEGVMTGEQFYIYAVGERPAARR